MVNFSKWIFITVIPLFLALTAGCTHPRHTLFPPGQTPFEPGPVNMTNSAMSKI